ncbi:putative de-etiolated-like protein 1 [Operophtera brumata]|uniref:Putative de-etiolated-like protein 1 n=2 Tax=Obtectomera TaxID=104431 RepID=A0A0L7L8S7_OPEBR|nr:putative de-etiolated-like protein 1 [Operophtera brumata]
MRGNNIKLLLSKPSLSFENRTTVNSFTKIGHPGNMASTSKSTVYYEDLPAGSNNEKEFFCTERIVPRKIKPQNIVLRLRDREIYGSRKPGSHFHVAREFYQNVFPNLTIIYEYRGASAAGDLVAGYPLDLLNTDANTHHKIRTHIFYRFFKPKFTVNVCQQREAARLERNNAHMPFMEQQLNRECSLFTEDGRYVIVGSAAHIPDDLRPHFYHIHSNNEAVTPTIRSALEDYSLHLVDLHYGRLCDTKHFRIDKIYLSHNQGIYLYKEVLAVLSVQHQTIHLFQIVEGMLIEMRKIGRFCYDDDPFIVSSVFTPVMNERPFHEETINSLKHRLLVFLFKRAKSISDETKDPLELRKFYKYFDMFKSLRMWKMQLLDEDHLFIKYASEEVVTLRVAEPNSQSSFFVIYNISCSKILEVFENTSEGLLQLFENYCDCFRNARLCADSQFTCSPSNNLFARLTQQRFKQTIERAIYGGRTEATKRILAQLPISAQSYSGSPYLDLGLFSYDDKWVSVMERPKAYGEYPIRFYARDSGLLKFKIYAGVLGQSVPASARRLVAFTFHPTDPFAISVQRTNSEYIVNFHIRNAFHNDICTSTSDIHYFYPNLRTCEWLRQPKVCVAVQDVPMHSPYEVICTRPCRCIPMDEGENTATAKCNCKMQLQHIERNIDQSEKDCCCHKDKPIKSRNEKHKKSKRKELVICECKESDQDTSDKNVTTSSNQASGYVPEEGRKTQTAACGKGHETQSACGESHETQTPCKTSPVKKGQSANKKFKTDLWIPKTSKKAKKTNSSEHSTDVSETCCSSCASDKE